MRQRWLELVAEAAHEANRAFGHSISELMPSWSAAPQEMRKSVLEGVIGILQGDTPEQSHQRWMDGKAADGWTYGKVKDAEAKTHPCMVPYAELPHRDRAKDEIFATVVNVVAKYIEVFGMKFKGGDVVAHSEMRCRMTVERQSLVDDLVYCVWFDENNNLRRAALDPAKLNVITVV